MAGLPTPLISGRPVAPYGADEAAHSVKNETALIILIAIMNLLAIAEVSRARLRIHEAVTYYRVAFALSVCGALGAIFF